MTKVPSLSRDSVVLYFLDILSNSVSEALMSIQDIFPELPSQVRQCGFPKIFFRFQIILKEKFCQVPVPVDARKNMLQSRAMDAWLFGWVRKDFENEAYSDPRNGSLWDGGYSWGDE
ncbi:hypothetical protein HG531_013161 [Fusarium graminearum]|nr:hypothetical protein HG531_013161 [Fusarium graminearum]